MTTAREHGGTPAAPGPAERAALRESATAEARFWAGLAYERDHARRGNVRSLNPDPDSFLEFDPYKSKGYLDRQATLKSRDTARAAGYDVGHDLGGGRSLAGILGGTEPQSPSLTPEGPSWPSVPVDRRQGWRRRDWRESRLGHACHRPDDREREALFEVPLAA